jgi:Asp-tRNAAsn/Glu-tRNAGln amidotransferase A subunit and related amidases
LRAAGAQITTVDIPHAELTPAVYIHIHSAEGATYHAKTLDSHADRYTPVVRRRLELGRYVLAQDYVRAMDGRELLRSEVDTALQGADALVLPTLPIAAPHSGAELTMIGGREEPVRALMLRLTQLFNITGHPAIAVPAGTTEDGWPLSIQLVGHIAGTRRLIQVAATVERYSTGGDGSVGGGTG